VVIGVSGGTVLAALIELRYALPPIIDWSTALGVGLATILLSSMVSLAPAMHAAMVDPVEALRVE
jgi:ABC-type lipoprotein release transport system permease subunit